MKKTLFLFLLLTAFATGMQAQTFTAKCATGQELRYQIQDDGKSVAVTGIVGENYPHNLSIPESVTFNGTAYAVTSIGEGAFQYCSDLTSVNIPNSITSIEDWTFSFCNNLTSINIPNSVASIRNWAFMYCSKLTFINIPNSISSIGEGAFSYCKSLTSINIPNSVTFIGNWAFSKCERLTSINIPNSVTSIGKEAFYKCDSLTSVNIPNSVTEIGWRAFELCTSLTSINSPNSVTHIGEGAFAGCYSLTSINIPNSVISIGEGAFLDCTSLTSISVDKDNSTYSYRNIGNRDAIIETATSKIVACSKKTDTGNNDMDDYDSYYYNKEWAYRTYDPNIPTSLTWNETYKLYNTKVIDTIYDENKGYWELVFGDTEDDIREHWWWSAIIINTAQEKRYLLPRHRGFKIDEIYSGFQFNYENDPLNIYNVDYELLGDTGSGLLSHSMYNGFPRYVFFDGNETGTDNYIYVFDFKTKIFTRICPGTIQKVIPPDNILISQLLYDYEEYYDGDKYLGLKCMEKIITPTGKVIWKGDVYYRK